MATFTRLAPNMFKTMFGQSTIDEIAAIKPDDAKPVPARDRMKKMRTKKMQERIDHIVMLDFETDPFDAIKREEIYPFVCCLHSDHFDDIIIWDDDKDRFVLKVIEQIENLPQKDESNPKPYTIYAHNGGKFDYMFLMHKLRGRALFKGRGLMRATIGMHELRDSFHLIPEKLASYVKENFDYRKMKRCNRHKFKEEIIKYLKSDCAYLHELLKDFLRRYGFKLSIGQAAMSELKKHYGDIIENVTEKTDAYLREYFFGGRVECFKGPGDFSGAFKYLDVNSMYPHVMATRRHPVGNRYMPRTGQPGPNTCFVNLTCVSKGAFPIRTKDDGTIFPDDGIRRKYRVSIHEYEIALKYNLIDRVTINYCVDNNRMTNFAEFVLPLYKERQETKVKLRAMAKAGLEKTKEYFEIKRLNIFLKFLLNNAFGKFTQNCRDFKEFEITDWNKEPENYKENGWTLDFKRTGEYAIWARPQTKWRFLNVGTGASITGAARAVLLEAKALAINPVYCDTDSIICEGFRENNIIQMSEEELGAWDIEAKISRLIITGRKTYCYDGPDLKEPVKKGKGVAGLNWQNYEDMLAGHTVLCKAKAPTLDRYGGQSYIDRNIRTTAKAPGDHHGRQCNASFANSRPGRGADGVTATA